VMAVNQTVDYWSDEFAHWVKVAYQPCDYISVREPRSLERLRSLGLEHTQLVPDAAFLTGSVSEQKARAFLVERAIAEGYIALFLGENVARAGTDKIGGLIDGLQQRLGRQVALFAAPGVDVKAAKELQLRMAMTVIGMDAYPEMLVGILSLASLVVSGRFHCCIFAALAGTPWVSFRSNTDKIEGLMELLGYSVPVTVLEESSNEDLLEVVERVWQNRARLQEELRQNVPQVVRIALEGYPNVLGSR